MWMGMMCLRVGRGLVGGERWKIKESIETPEVVNTVRREGVHLYNKE